MPNALINGKNQRQKSELVYGCERSHNATKCIFAALYDNQLFGLMDL